MNKIKAVRKIKLRKKILIAFIFLMLISFSLTGVIFNIAAWQYIENSAILRLEPVDNMLEHMKNWQTEAPQIVIDIPQTFGHINSRSVDFRIQANMFLIDENKNSVNGINFSKEINEIIQTISNEDLNELNYKRIRTDSGFYYISAHFIGNSISGENVYWVIYADVTGLSLFANAINLFLILLVGVMFFLTIIVSFFLSKSITNPIKKLNSLAINIGHGDFIPNNFKFNIIEFENLNTTLNKTANQLALYDNEQKAFFQNASHELRTPLMSIKCYAEGIAYNVMDSKKASNIILQETDRMSEMVTDLLYISKIDNITSSYTKVNIDLLDIIRTAAKQQEAIAGAKKVSFTFDFKEPNIFYNCVPELIERAVGNLISNSIRYASSEIILSCYKENNEVIIQISDDGEGVKDENLPHIFKRFYKGDGGNHGIGLSLVKSIAQQHNGNITAYNNVESGAVFKLILPDITIN